MEPARQQGQRQEALDACMAPAQIDGTVFPEAIMQSIRDNSGRIEFCKRRCSDGRYGREEDTLPCDMGGTVHCDMETLSPAIGGHCLLEP